jgi:hypothetical protein
MTEKLWVQTLHWGDHFSCTIHLDQSMEAKIKWKLTICCISCNPAKGRVDFEDGWLIKSSFIRVKWKLVSWPGPKSHQKKKTCLAYHWSGRCLFSWNYQTTFFVSTFSQSNIFLRPSPKFPGEKERRLSWDKRPTFGRRTKLTYFFF